jgi:sugar/nucleoside kinase (ribokinase family)
MIGTGGIGSGMFFALDGERTLGREESRSGRFLEGRDYCKLHIVSHYVKALLGEDFRILPIGAVGSDDIGDRLLGEMREIGLDLRYVERVRGRPTLFAVCFVYPDGSGGNLTANDSACSAVDGARVMRAEREFAQVAGRGVALALPEVPLEARRTLLSLGTHYGFLRVASFNSGEIREAVAKGDLREVDLLAVNLDEAAAAAGVPTEGEEAADIVAAVVHGLSAKHGELQLTITAGSRGSWSWSGAVLNYLPAFRAPVVSTAGAGDAHLAGTIAGLCAGMPLSRAHELGALSAAMSVTSPHTINKEINWAALRAFAAGTAKPISETVRALLAS